MKNSMFFHYLLLVWFAGTSCTGPKLSSKNSAQADAHRSPASAPAPHPDPIDAYDYPKLFDVLEKFYKIPGFRTRLSGVPEIKAGLAVSKEDRDLLGYPSFLSEIPESEFLEYLQREPKALEQINNGALDKILAAKDSEQFKLLVDFFKIAPLIGDPTKPYSLTTPDESLPVTDIKMIFDHTLWIDGKTIAKSNMSEAVVDFIREAKREIVLNIFDFDLLEVAQALVDQANAGLSVRVGIDSKNITQRGPAKAVYDLLLTAPTLKVHRVETSTLNHQKLIATDWTSPKDARVLVSSGNFSQSCIGYEGDLEKTDAPPEIRSVYGIPNANHLLTMKSYAIANLVNHELTKVIDFEFKGTSRSDPKSYPMSGAYTVIGPRDPMSDQPIVMTLAFSPNGAYGNINQDIIAKMILTTQGPVRMLQFAYSSEEVNQALLKRAQAEIKRRGQFEFGSIADLLQATSSQSKFMDMVALKAELQSTNGIQYKQFVEDKSSPWLGVLGAGIANMRENVLLAPPRYGNQSVEFEDSKGHTKRVKISALVHHKVMISGDEDFISGSFNFSNAALKNQEQIIWIKSQSLAKKMIGAYEQLRKESKEGYGLKPEKVKSYIPDMYRLAISRNKKIKDDALKHKKNAEASEAPAEAPNEVGVEPAAAAMLMSAEKESSFVEMSVPAAESVRDVNPGAMDDEELNTHAVSKDPLHLSDESPRSSH